MELSNETIEWSINLNLNDCFFFLFDCWSIKWSIAEEFFLWQKKMSYQIYAEWWHFNQISRFFCPELILCCLQFKFIRWFVYHSNSNSYSPMHVIYMLNAKSALSLFVSQFLFIFSSYFNRTEMRKKQHGDIEVMMFICIWYIQLLAYENDERHILHGYNFKNSTTTTAKNSTVKILQMLWRSHDIHELMMFVMQNGIFNVPILVLMTKAIVTSFCYAFCRCSFFLSNNFELDQVSYNRLRLK